MPVAGVRGVRGVRGMRGVRGVRGVRCVPAVPAVPGVRIGPGSNPGVSPDAPTRLYRRMGSQIRRVHFGSFH